MQNKMALMSTATLQQLIAAAQAEIDFRTDCTLRIGEKCYADIKGERKDFILRGVRRKRGLPVAERSKTPKTQSEVSW